MSVEELAIPAAILAAIVVLFMLALASRRRGRSRERGETQLLAAVQAERDVLRANHAVEIAALEGRLAEALKKAAVGGDTEFRIKAADGAARSAEAARAELAGTLERLTAERDRLLRDTAASEALLAERDRARAETARSAEIAAELRRENQTLRERLGDATGGDAARLAGELAAAREAAEAARRALDERDRTVAELRAAGADDEAARLREALAAATERERAANENLSRLAYEREGLRGRLATMERSESEAKAATEKQAALVELRTQRIGDLEAALREAKQQMREAAERAAAAEDTLRNRTAPPEEGRLDRLQGKLDQVRDENASLLEELEAMRRSVAAAAEEPASGPATSGELERLREENRRLADAAAALERLREEHPTPTDAAAELDRLREENRQLAAAAAAAPRVDEGELERLRAEIRMLAERFAAEAEASAAAAPSAEQSLADRIRAFKAKRAAAPSAGA